jgi:hypothetical protein
MAQAEQYSRRHTLGYGGVALAALVVAGAVWKSGKARIGEVLRGRLWHQQLDLVLISKSGMRIPSVLLPPGTEGVVIYAMKKGCSWCEKNQESVNNFAAQAGPRLKFYGVTLEEPWPSNASYVFPVYSLSRQSKDRGIVRVTPTTLILNQSGMVKKTIEGAYIGSNRVWIESTFGVFLKDVL